MRKLLLTATFAAAVAFVSAQSLTSKDGTPILPEDGDWSISIDAAPLGTIFRNTGGSALENQYLQNNTIIGKKMISANSAIRVKFRIGLNTSSIDSLSAENGSTTTPPATVTDTKSTSAFNVTIGAGYQKYRGKGRIQGYYGGEFNVMFGSSKSTYDYGNPINTANPTPARANFDGNAPTNGPYTTESKNGSTFGFGLRGFIGAEYFFAAKMSLGVEYGWGLMLSATGTGSQSTEFYNGVTGAPDSNTSDTGASGSFSLDVDHANGSVYLSFYF